MFFAFLGCTLYSNFHAPREAGKHFSANVCDVMAEIEKHGKAVRMVSAVKRGGVVEIRAYDHKSRFESRFFCIVCDNQFPERCSCVEEVMRS
jgi:hypothetical protein